MEATGSRGRAPHRHKKLRWEYTGVLTKQPSKTALKRSAPPTTHAPTPLDPPLAASFLSDASMATSHSQTTAASSHDPQTPTTPVGVITPQQVSTTAAPPPPRISQRPPRASVDTDELARVGRVAKKRVEALAQRDALVGRWRRRRLDAVEQLLAAPPSTSSSASAASSTSSSSSSSSRLRRRRADSARVECQVLDFTSRRRDEYKMLARMNIAGSLRELMGVLATDNAAHFHRAMAALFGAQYLTGENVAASESVGMRRARSTSARLGSKALVLASRRQSTPAVRPLSASAGPPSSSSASAFGRSSASFSNIKLALNAVTLQQRHGLFRRQLLDWQFLDYLDENVDAMTVTRVLQTVGSSSSSSSSSGPRRRVGDVFAGYVIREDREAQFTRVFFYGEARAASGKVAKPAKKLLRGMVETLCRLVATVERQRLSALYRQHRGSESVPVAASRCFACNASFGLSAGRRRHTCACCRESVCRQCLEEREVETGGDGDGGSAATKALAIGPPVVQRVRVCRGCVDRVSLPTLAAVRGSANSRGSERPTARHRGSDIAERDDESDEDDDDDVVVVDACSDISSYHWE